MGRYLTVYRPGSPSSAGLSDEIDFLRSKHEVAVDVDFQHPVVEAVGIGKIQAHQTPAGQGNADRHDLLRGDDGVCRGERQIDPQHCFDGAFGHRLQPQFQPGVADAVFTITEPSTRQRGERLVSNAPTNSNPLRDFIRGHSDQPHSRYEACCCRTRLANSIPPTCSLVATICQPTVRSAARQSNTTRLTARP